MPKFRARSIVEQLKHLRFRANVPERFARATSASRSGPRRVEDSPGYLWAQRTIDVLPSTILKRNLFPSAIDLRRTRWLMYKM